jgi:segregation and condensation protein A
MSAPTGSRSSLPEAWHVQLPTFEGPLDLLLHLIKINEVEITDIPVAVICDQFHEYLQLMEVFDLDVAAEFVYEAAVLIHLKSRMLLPSQTSEDGSLQDDPRRELVERLLEYQRIKEAAQSLAEVHSLRQGLWTRQRRTLELADTEETLELGEVSLFDLLGAFRQALSRYDREHPDPLHVRRETFTVRSQFERLMAVLDEDRSYDLLADLRQRSCRSEAVAAFLAILELARLDLIRLHRTDLGEILLYRTRKELQAHELEGIQG